MNFKFYMFLLLVLINLQNAWAADKLENIINEKKIVLTENEQIIYNNGELGAVRYTIGGILGVYPGFGIGHGVQGRWSSRGKVITFGEIVSVGVALTGLISCASFSTKNSECSNDATKIGLISFGVFKIWEIIDVWYGGYRQMGDYKSLEKKLLDQADKPKSSFYLLPSISPRTAGLQLGMTF